MLVAYLFCSEVRKPISLRIAYEKKEDSKRGGMGLSMIGEIEHGIYGWNTYSLEAWNQFEGFCIFMEF